MTRIVAQRRDWDCGIAALAFYCGLQYEDVIVAAVRVRPEGLRHGLTTGDLVRVARRLGRRFTRVHWRQVDLEESNGLLIIVWDERSRKRRHDGAYGHAVVLRNGLIIDPTGPSIAEADEYLAVEGGRPGTLLVEMRKGKP